MAAGTPEYWKERGNDAIARRDLREAITSYQRALFSDPYYEPAWHNLGLVCERLGFLDGARYCFSWEERLSAGGRPTDPGDALMTRILSGREVDVVELDAIDGFEFEALCGEIYNRLGYTVEQTPLVRDGGMDIILHEPDGETIIVECKHQPEGTIGRPVVQKLHSAVISSGASRGILVTTGRFSQDAIAHAAGLVPPIDLVDRSILVDTATRAGFALQFSGMRESIWIYPLSPLPAIWRWIVSDIAEDVTGYPISLPALRLEDRRILLSPAYRITYDIDFECATTVGVIHHEKARGRHIFLDGMTGGDMPDHTFLSGTPVLEFSLPQNLPQGVSRGIYAVDSQSAKNIALERIVRAHTREIVYYGMNNQRYVKMCTPSRRHILVRNVQQVLVPHTEATIISLKKTCTLKAIENAKALMCKTDLYTCGFCHGFMRGEKIFLCNSCGSLVHAPSLLDPCSTICRSCGKTICRSCTFVAKGRGKICAECAKRLDPSAQLVGQQRNQRAIVAAVCGIGGVALIYFNPLIGLFFLVSALTVLLKSGTRPVPEYIIVNKKGE